MNDESTDSEPQLSSVHERLGELCINFHQLQDELLQQASAEQGVKLREIATLLISLSLEQLDQVLGELKVAALASYL